jgi:hypothetical protein
MEFLRMVSEPSRSQWLPDSGREISISLLSLANISQYLSGIIEAALHGMAAETAVGDIEPTAELRRNIAERIGAPWQRYTRSAAAAKPEYRIMSNL